MALNGPGLAGSLVSRRSEVGPSFACGCPLQPVRRDERDTTSEASPRNHRQSTSRLATPRNTRSGAFAFAAARLAELQDAGQIVQYHSRAPQPPRGGTDRPSASATAAASPEAPSRGGSGEGCKLLDARRQRQFTARPLMRQDEVELVFLVEGGDL
jgi:hypothetical protein